MHTVAMLATSVGLMKIMYETSLGSKNSQGFVMSEDVY